MVSLKKFTLFALVLMCMMSCVFTFGVSAEEDMGSVGVQDVVTEQATDGGSSSRRENQGIAGFMKDYNAVTDEQMAESEAFASPILALVGNAIGLILILVVAGLTLVTALDLCYIGLPFTRSLLAPQQAGGMVGMGGQQAKPRLQLVSDEALASISTGGSSGVASSPTPVGGMGGYGGMSPMGSMGGMGGMSSTPSQLQGIKSAIFTYFKKRIIFLVLFAVAAIVLTSSILTDCGINIAYLFMDVLEKIMGLMA